MPVVALDEYEAPVQEILDTGGILMECQLIGDDCPRFCESRGEPGIGTFPRKNHIHGQHWRVTFSRSLAVKPFVVDFWDSYHDAEYRWIRKHFASLRKTENSPSFYRVCKKHGLDPDSLIQSYRGNRGHALPVRDLKPSAYDVLACIVKYELAATFEDFCGDFGYSIDSRRAEETYRAAQDEYRRFVRFFTEEEAERLREVAA